MLENVLIGQVLIIRYLDRLFMLNFFKCPLLTFGSNAGCCSHTLETCLFQYNPSPPFLFFHCFTLLFVVHSLTGYTF